LGARDLVPLVSWIASRGRCRHCGAWISPAYPLTELVAAGIGAAAAALVPSTLSAGVVAVVGWWLLALALIDLRTFRLPDALTLPLLAAGLLLGTARTPVDMVLPNPTDAAIGTAAGFLVLAGIRWLYARARGVEGLGLGDAKLAAAAGCWLGWAVLPLLLLFAASAALVGALIVHRRLRGDLAVPFGPALALAFWTLLLAAQRGG
jgi:leader peptidase (prepilin peptidase)/N-methyltransferase